MNRIQLVIFIFFVSFSLPFSAQTDDMVKEDFQASSVNQSGKEFPKVNSEGLVRVRVEAPKANNVQLDIGGMKYDLKKNDEGVWTGE